MGQRTLRKNPGQETFEPRGPATSQVFNLLVCLVYRVSRSWVENSSNTLLNYDLFN